MDIIAAFNKALKHQEAGELELAVEGYREVIKVRPDIAVTYSNIGIALSALGRTDEAISYLENAMRIDSTFISAYINIIPILRNVGRLEEAEVMCWRLMEISPNDGAAHSMLIQILVEREKFEAAIHIARSAPPVCKDTLNYWLSYGSALSGIGLRGAEETVEAFRKAISLNPTRDLSHFGLAEALLRQGDFEEGWVEYEWVLPCHDYPKPIWRGEDLRGKTILIYKDLGFAGGFGDVFHLVRYIPMVEALGARVILMVPITVMRLLATTFPTVTVVGRIGTPLDFDFHTTLMRLPRILGTTLETIPTAVPYLQPASADVERWRERLAGLSGLKVGLVWAGQRRLNEHGSERDDYRHTTLSKLERLLTIEGVSFVSLQTGPQAREIHSLPDPAQIYNPMNEVNDFADTAAVVANLDLVISVDTSVVHLSGALNKPVWILMAYNACGWRWMMEREDTPWYPTGRIFRQKAAGAWSEVATRVERELRKVARGEIPLAGTKPR